MVEFARRPDGSFQRGFGGDTLNTAIYLARLGIPTDYVTALGDDRYSGEMLDAWRAEGIGTEGVIRMPGRMPGLYVIQTDDRGERSFYYWRDMAPVRQLFTMAGSGAAETRLRGAGMIYLSGITLSLFGEEGRERLFALLAEARRAGTRIAFDSNFRPRGWPDRDAARVVFDRMFAGSDIVLTSVEDDALLHGEASAAGSLERLRSAGVVEAVVKLPTQECIVAAEGAAETRVTAEPVSAVVDTTAAGDSFAAAYLAARASGRDPVTAARAGHRLAGTVVGYPGAIIPKAAMPSAAV